MEQSDTLLKPKCKNKIISYAQSKSEFGQAHFIIYFYVCVENFWRSGNFICYSIFRVSTSHLVWTHVLIVPCDVSHISNP